MAARKTPLGMWAKLKEINIIQPSEAHQIWAFRFPSLDHSTSASFFMAIPFCCAERRKKAIIAITRMLLATIYNILKKNEPYNPELYLSCNNALPEHRAVSVEEAIFILQCQVYLVTPTALDRFCYNTFSAAARWLGFLCPFRDGACVTMFQPFPSGFHSM